MTRNVNSEVAPFQGVGVGLRAPHFDHIIAHKPQVDWFEVLADNYLQPNCMARKPLMQIRQDYPMVLHSVGMSLGAQDPLNLDYFRRYRDLIALVEPALVSDHLCWISNQQQYLHELLPLPFTEECIRHVSERIKQVQDLIGRQIAVENISSYLQYEQSSMSEWEFVNAIASEADCLILFDINNLYVNAVNHGIDPQEFVANIDGNRVTYCHLAGFEDMGTHLLDTHGAGVFDPVWELYERAMRHLGNVPTLIEWDNNLPTFDVLFAEAERARQIMETADV